MKQWVMIVLLSAFAVAVCSGCGQEACRPVQEAGSCGRTGISKFLAERQLPSVKAVRPWQFNGRDGVEIETRHYRIFTTLGDYLVTGELPGFLESAHKQYQKQVPRTLKTTTPFTVYLFGTREEWEEFTDDFTGPDSELYRQITRGAYVDKGVCVAWYLGRDQTFSILGHEGWHQFSGRHFKYRLPSWLDEGMATLFEEPLCKRGIWQFEPQRNVGRLGGLKRTIVDGRLLSLEELISLSPGQVLSADASEWRAFYSQAYALVRFLREEDYGKRFGNYQAMLLGGLDGTWPVDEAQREVLADRNIPMPVDKNAQIGRTLFEQYIGDAEDIEQGYVTFCKKATYRIQLIEKLVTVAME